MAKLLQFVLYLVLIINYCRAFEIDILKEYGLLRNNVNNLNSHFIRFNSYKEKSFTRSSTFNNENVDRLTIEVIFRFDKTFNQIFDIFSLYDKNYDNIFWIGVEKNQELAVYTKSTDKIFATFKNAKIIDEKWHKAVVSYNKGNIKLWLDGKLIEQPIKFHEEIKFNVPEVGSVIGYMDEAPTEIYGNFDLKKLWLYTGRIRPDECFNGDMPSNNGSTNSSNLNRIESVQSATSSSTTTTTTTEQEDADKDSSTVFVHIRENSFNLLNDVMSMFGFF